MNTEPRSFGFAGTKDNCSVSTKQQNPNILVEVVVVGKKRRDEVGCKILLSLPFYLLQTAKSAQFEQIEQIFLLNFLASRIFYLVLFFCSVFSTVFAQNRVDFCSVFEQKLSRFLNRNLIALLDLSIM